MNPRNLIHGQLPQFGNPEHIAYVKEKTAILKGEINFYTIDWLPCIEWGRTTETRKPVFRYCSFRNANALVDYIPCPKCGRLHCLLFNFDPQGNWYDELIAVDEAAKEFSCWNCKQEFTTDEDRNVYCKPEEI